MSKKEDKIKSQLESLCDYSKGLYKVNLLKIDDKVLDMLDILSDLILFN